MNSTANYPCPTDLVQRINVHPCQLAVIKSVRNHLHSDLGLVNHVSRIDYALDVNRLLGVLRDLLEIESEANSFEFSFNLYLIKLVILKLELMRSCITVKSEELGIKLFNELDHYIRVLTECNHAILLSNNILSE